MNIATRGGPVTKAGKKISSKNALKHGLTSLSFVSPEEQTRYDFLLKMFQEEYHPKTITEELYIGKIANLQIRLERVIKAEQASIALAQKNVTDNTIVIDSLDIDMDSKKQYALNEMAGLYKDKSDTAMVQRGLQRVLLSEISKLKQQAPIFIYDIIQENHLFLETIFKTVALREDISVATLLKVPHSEQDNYVAKIVSMNPPTAEEELEIFKQSEVVSSEIPAELLQSFLEKLYHKLMTLNLAAWIDSEFENLKELHLHSAMPDPATMDRFMRYSTALNNQLSKAIGELRHIIKERKAEEKLLADQ